MNLQELNPEKEYRISLRDIKMPGEVDMKIYKASFDIFDTIDEIHVIHRLFKCIMDSLDLTPHGNFSLEFPTPWGTGGKGITAVQSFTESYAAIDTWPEKQYANLYICSCKEIDPGIVINCIRDEFPKSRIGTEILKAIEL
jgi:S-adenosylmethionine/arginine decarboxylase-like enzyme